MKNKEQRADPYETLIDDLFKIKNIRYAVVTDDLGNRYRGGMKEGVKSTTPLDIEKRLETQAVLILKMAEGYVPFDGKLYYCSIHWQKVVAYFFLISKGERVLAITVDAKAPPGSLSRIRKLVEKWKK